VVDVILRNAASDGAATNLEGRWFALGSDATTQASNERLQPSYDAASGGVAALSAPLGFTGTPSAAVSHLLVYAASSGGSVQIARPLSGDLAFNSEGNLNLTAAPVPVDEPA
jgi:hypothetical protein